MAARLSKQWLTDQPTIPSFFSSFQTPVKGITIFISWGSGLSFGLLKLSALLCLSKITPIVNVSKQTCDITYISDVLTLSNSPFVIIFAWRKGVAIFFSINSWNYILVFFLTFSKKILLTYLDVDELDVSPLRKRRQPS